MFISIGSFQETRKYVPKPVDFDEIWEDAAFMDAFCSGCSELAAVANSPDLECPAGADPHCALCARHALAVSVDGELKEAAIAITAHMRRWGCFF